MADENKDIPIIDFSSEEDIPVVDFSDSGETPLKKKESTEPKISYENLVSPSSEELSPFDPRSASSSPSEITQSVSTQGEKIIEPSVTASTSVGVQPSKTFGSYVKEDKEGVGNRAGYIYNSLLRNIGSMSSGVVDMMIQAGVNIPGAIPEGESKDEAIKQLRKDILSEVREGLKNVVGAEVSEEKERKYNDEFITSALGGLTSVVTAASPFQSGLFFNAYDGALQSIENTEVGKDMPEITKTIFAGSVGTAARLLEKYGLDKIFGKQSTSAAKKIAMDTMLDLVEKSEGKAITQEAFEVALDGATKTLKDKVVSAGGKIGKGALVEFTTGAGQEAFNVGAEQLLNKTQGKEIFEPKSWGEQVGRILKAGAQEAVGGGVMGTVSIPFSKTRNYISEKVSEAESPEDIAKLKAELTSDLQTGNISEEEAIQINGLVDEYAKIYSTIPSYANNRKEAAEKIIERNGLRAEAEAKAQEAEQADEAFRPDLEAEAKAFNNRADELNKEINPKKDIEETVEVSETLPPTPEAGTKEGEITTIIKDESKSEISTQEGGKEGVSTEESSQEGSEEKRLLKPTESEGGETTPPLSEQSSQEKKEYQDIAGLSPKTESGRIPVSPILGGKPKDLRQIVSDVTKGTKQRLLFAKPSGMRRAAGTYSPGSTAVKIKFNGDLDTTAHELGHSLDDSFSILTDIKKNPNPTLESELNKFSPFGSKPPKGHPDPRGYKLNEGFAEWLRAFVVNPDQAIADAPELYKLYQTKVSEDYKKAINDFSTDIRIWAGSSGRDITLANVEFYPEKKGGLIDEILRDKSGKYEISWVDKLAANFVNPLRAFDKAFEFAKDIKGIDYVPPSKDPTILSRLLLGVDGKYGEILQSGMIDGTGNVLKSGGNVKNLKWLLEPLDNTDEASIQRDMKDVIAYMVSQRTLELSKREGVGRNVTGVGGGVFSDIDVAKKTIDEIEGDKGKFSRIKEASDRYREFADDILKYMVDKGRLSKEGYDYIKENNEYYVALRRVMETEPGVEVDVFSKGTGSLASKREIIKKAKGSAKSIVNPYISLIDTLHKSIRESDRNEVLGSFRDMLIEQRGMNEGEVKDFAQIGVKGSKGDKNSIAIFVNGKPEYWVFQDDLYKALKGLDNEGYKLPGAITALPRMLRWTVTNYPVFAMRNMVRDFFDRVIKSEDKSGVKHLMGDKEHWNKLARSGGLNTGYYLSSKESYYGLLQEAMNDLSKNKKTILADAVRLHKYWNGYTNLLKKSETVNRVAEYRAAFENGKKKRMDDYNASLYAASKARDLVDFAMMGHYMKVVNQLIPFSNAAIQSLRKTVKTATNNPVGFTARMFAYTVVPNIALWLLNHDDEETAKEYENMPSYQRDMFWNIKIAPNTWVSVPKPYELSLLSAGTDRTMSRYFYNNKDAFKGYGGSVAKSMLPLDEGNISGPMQGVVEGITNYDFFRNKAIVPPRENNLNLALRNTENASRLGRAIQEVSGIDGRKIDHFIKSQLSYYGNLAVKVSDLGKDRSQSKFSLSDLGFFKQTPAYNSPSVQDFIKFAQEWNLTSTGEYREFSRMAKKYFNEENSRNKEDIGDAIVDYAKIQLKSWEESNIKGKRKEGGKSKVKY